MIRKCVVCGRPLDKDEVCHGIIKGMEVSVCREHMEQCDRCETKYCERRDAP